MSRCKHSKSTTHIGARWLVLAALGIWLAGCGGGGGGGGSAPAPNPYPVSISSPEASPDPVDSTTLALSGSAFVPSGSACSCVGLGCFFGHGTLADGYQVTCTNLTTGDTGYVSFYLNCLLQTKVIWNANIALASGANLIQIEAVDANGNSGLATLEITRLPDTTAPQVVSVLPVDGALEIGLNPSIIVQFNEAMDAASINAGSLLLNEASGASIASSVTPGTSSNTWKLTPIAPLAYATSYRVTLGVEIRDLAGNVLSAPVIASFTTLTVPDVAPPFVVATSPQAGTHCAGSFTPVVVTFNEYVDVDTLSFTLMGPGDLPVNGYVSHQEGTYIWTFVAYDFLDTNATYTARIAAGLQDFSGNASSTPFSWSFGTSLDSVDYCN